MKQIFIIVLLFVGSLMAESQSLLGLEDIMKNKVGTPFKIVYLHVVKVGQIDPKGSTLAAAQQAYAGLQEGALKAPSQFLDVNGQLKDEESKSAFSRYQMGMQAMIVEVGKLIEILAMKSDDEAAKVAAAKAQIQMIVQAQKQAHDQFKEE